LNLLLDTHAFLWWITDDPRMSSRARRSLTTRANEVYFSAVSAWEIAIKSKTGLLPVLGDPTEWVPAQLQAQRFRLLPVSISHALATYHLPTLHRDPFDRLLIAQAQLEGLGVVTIDTQIAGYGVKVVW